MKKIILYSVLALCLIIFLTFITKTKKNPKLYKKINEQIIVERDQINKYALPVIDNGEKYIELQTKNWIKQRNDRGCYGLLEKDKILMAKWINHFKINAPKIYFFGYHNQFKKQQLVDIAMAYPEKRFIIKITHLQSNYGIINVPPYKDHYNTKYLDDIYNKCLTKFMTCFVCNHDKSDPPRESEIKKGRKDSYYKLYETIEPGIIIQEFFFSKGQEMKMPIEKKILVLGDKIIGGADAGKPIEKMKFVYQEAKRISKLLGSSLVRVDFFVKESDDPYIPYLNEISLSPNGGMKHAGNITSETLLQYKEEVKKYEPNDMPFVDKLIENCPHRTIAIDKYLSDADWGTWWYDKFKFGLLK